MNPSKHIFLLFVLCSLRAAGPARSFEIPLTKTQRAQKLVEEGRGLILHGDYMHAVDFCTRALDIRKDWAPAYLCRSEARLLSRDPLANEDAQYALRLDPKSGEPFRLLGIMDFEAGRYRRALERFDEALKQSKLRPEGLPDVYFYRARSQLNLGDLDAALKDVDHGIGVLQGLNGDFADWSFYSLRAEILRRAGKNEKADQDELRVIELVNARLRRRPYETVDLLRRRAESYSLLRDYDKAATDYGIILKNSTDDVKVMIDQAQALSLAGRHAQAIRGFNQALRIDPRNLQALRLRALERITIGDHRTAVRDLNTYLKLEPDDASALAYRGVSKRFLEDWRGSLADLERSQKLNPKDKVLWGHKAFVQEMLGRHEAALRSAYQALLEDPEDTSAHIARSQAGVILGRCQEVSSSMDWLVSKSTASSQYRWLRGECRCDKGNFSQGIADLENAAALEPQSPILAQRLAHQHRRYLDLSPHLADTNALRKSKQYYDQARSLASLEPKYLIERARTLWDLGKLHPPEAAQERERLWKEALQDCDTALLKQPKNREAQRWRQIIRKSLSNKK